MASSLDGSSFKAILSLEECYGVFNTYMSPVIHFATPYTVILNSYRKIQQSLQIHDILTGINIRSGPSSYIDS